MGECLSASSDELASELSYKPKIEILASLYFYKRFSHFLNLKNISNPTFAPGTFFVALKGTTFLGTQ